MSVQVAAIGDNCLDVYIEQGVLTVGGNSLNVAVDWALAGLSASYHGAVGDDPAATVVLDVLSEAGLDAGDVAVRPGPTGVTLIRLVDNDRQFVFEEFGVGATWTPDGALIERLSEMAWVHVGGPLATTGLPVRLAAAGVRVSVDLSTSRGSGRLDGVEIAFGSWTGAQADGGPEERARRLTSLGARIGLLTCGENGSVVHADRRTTHVPARDVVPVDTCGAGDSYIAGFVAAHLLGRSLAECLDAATQAATRTCTHLGGFVQRPRAVPGWLKEQYHEHTGAPDRRGS